MCNNTVRKPKGSTPGATSLSWPQEATMNTKGAWNIVTTCHNIECLHGGCIFFYLFDATTDAALWMLYTTGLLWATAAPSGSTHPISSASNGHACMISISNNKDIKNPATGCQVQTEFLQHQNSILTFHLATQSSSIFQSMLVVLKAS